MSLLSTFPFVEGVQLWHLLGSFFSAHHAATCFYLFIIIFFLYKQPAFNVTWQKVFKNKHAHILVIQQENALWKVIVKR